MDYELDSFDYFVDDLLSSNADLLKNELDFLLMQTLFKSMDLKEFQNVYPNDEYMFA